VLGDAGIADDPRFAGNALRCANRPALDAAIDAVFATLDGAAVIARLAAAGTAYASLNDVADLSRHPQLRRVEAASPTGPVALPAPPVRWAGMVATAGAVPAIGGDSDAIRAEFAP
jgi:crotonobetainyl-CoA:carnitine CoA-transferase CaiB-like acyl-CoA transferase